MRKQIPQPVKAMHAAAIFGLSMVFAATAAADYEEVREFTGGRPWKDDLTAVAVRMENC